MTNKIQTEAEFDSLLRRLVQVPKEELEAEERKYQIQRDRLREKGAVNTGKPKR